MRWICTQVYTWLARGRPEADSSPHDAKMTVCFYQQNITQHDSSYLCTASRGYRLFRHPFSPVTQPFLNNTKSAVLSSFFFSSSSRRVCRGLLMTLIFTWPTVLIQHISTFKSNNNSGKRCEKGARFISQEWALVPGRWISSCGTTHKWIWDLHYIFLVAHFITFSSNSGSMMT